MATNKPRLLDIFEGKHSLKVILILSVIVILIIELLIYLAAASQAGEKSRVIITNSQGEKVYETPGTTLSSYERMVFENTFGPLERYRIHIKTEQVPFPFRAWLTAAVGIPVGLVLLLAFVIRVFLALLYGSDESDAGYDPLSVSQNSGRVGSLFDFMRRFSVFHIGFLLVVSVLLFWMIPNFLGQFARIGVTTVREYKWFFLGTTIFLAILIVWVIYLRYQLSKKMLENQLDLEKFRVKQHLLMQEQAPALLTHSNDQSEQGE